MRGTYQYFGQQGMALVFGMEDTFIPGRPMHFFNAGRGGRVGRGSPSYVAAREKMGTSAASHFLPSTTSILRSTQGGEEGGRKPLTH